MTTRLSYLRFLKFKSHQVNVQNTASKGTEPMGILMMNSKTLERNTGIESLTTFTSLGARGDLETKFFVQSTAS